VTQDKESAVALLEKIREKITPENFGQLAKEYSDCSSYAANGDLGEFGKGQMDPNFEKAAFALKVGEISGIVESASGVHLIHRTE